MEKENVTFSDRLKASRKIIMLSPREKYNLVAVGWLKEFENNTMNYRYLAWWMGNEPVNENVGKKIYISETSQKIIIEKNQHD